jgi:endonuclease/exonuclease/phosphatase family metal-dependent hydrolase
MRLLSYNIHKGIGGLDRRYNLDRIWRVIEAESPDLVCLQEVTSGARRTRFHDQPELLARLHAGADRCFQMNVQYRVGGYGNLIGCDRLSQILGRHFGESGVSWGSKKMPPLP